MATQPLRMQGGSAWPTLPGNYTLGNPESPVAIAIIGRGNLVVVEGAYAIKGTITTENVGLEKLVANLVANPRIRFLIVCGREELGHLPAGAIKALKANGVDERMRIRDCRSAIPYLCNLSAEAVERFRDQIEIIDHADESDIKELPEYLATYSIDGADRDRIIASVRDCATRDPGPYPARPVTLDNDALRLEGENAARMNARSADAFTERMLRMPSEKLSTSAGLVTVSSDFGIIVEPIDGEVLRVVSADFAARLNAYLRGNG
jgi:tetrahydromethanopterin S-methyltransferase subunit A